MTFYCDYDSIDCLFILFEHFEIFALTLNKIMRIALVLVSFLFYQVSAADLSGNLFNYVERFGLPTVLIFFIWFFFSRQNEKRHQEMKEFWSDNNNYLRQLIREQKIANICNYANNHKKENDSKKVGENAES